ncbi:MAG: ParB/Srx family N-terminal domain-containing protein [Pseudolabrys sp.]
MTTMTMRRQRILKESGGMCGFWSISAGPPSNAEKRLKKTSLDQDKTLPPPSQFSHVAISDLSPNPANPRKHPKAQIQKLASSVASFGFCGAILVKDGQIVAGHARVEAAKLNSYSKIPAMQLDHLSDAQARAYMLADNRFTDLSSWDDVALATHLKEMSARVLEFDIEATGFESADIDVRIQSLGDAELAVGADEFQLASGPAVPVLGDLWLLGDHKVCCGSALDPNA